MAKKTKKKTAKKPKLPPSEFRKAKTRKKRRKPTPGVRSSHKARAGWFRDAVAWPMRDAPAGELLAARRAVRASLAPMHLAHPWEQSGPTNTGGRATCLVSHPADADLLWLGAAGGGVWSSEDAGRTWTPLWHAQESLNVGSLAIDPNNPQVLYCGTGEANLSADSYPGVGIYRSDNGGERWDLLVDALSGDVPSRIGALQVDPHDSKHLMAGGVGHEFPTTPRNSMGGLYESTDLGATWTRLSFVSDQDYRCHSIVFDPKNAGVVYVTISSRGMRNGIWRTRDGGAVWEQLTQGLPSPELFNRTSLAISPSDPDVLYALAARDADSVLGVFRTGDGGDSWRAVHGTAFHYKRFGWNYETQMTYNNTIAVHPTDPNHVVCGGVDLHRSTDGGAHWSRVTDWAAKIGDADYAHADHHAVVMPEAAPGRVYSANDGGLDVSEDGGTTWQNRSNGLAIAMFYDFAIAAGNADHRGGGAQDNGTPLTFTGSDDDYADLTDGDGGWIVFDPVDEWHFFTSSQNMAIYRYRAADGWKEVSPKLRKGDQVPWMCYIAMDPTRRKRLYTGTNRVWRTLNDGDDWVPVSQFLKGIVSAIEISRADPNRIYVGTTWGEVIRSLDGGKHWSGDIAGPEIPGVKITRIVTSPVDANYLFATVANFGARHVFRSRNGGVDWEPLGLGSLPAVPHSSVAIPTNHPNEVYVGTDVGVFVSIDSGDSWRQMSDGLPNVTVVDLVYHDAENTLTAATYGRGTWQTRVR